MLIASRNGMMIQGRQMMKIVLTQNATNCKDLADQIVSILAGYGISNAMCSIVASETRNNMVGIVPIINGVVTSTVLRYRSGAWGVANSIPEYDADARIGDVYNVYVPDGLWNSANLNGGGHKCVVILIICEVCSDRSRSRSPSRFSSPRQPSSEWRAAA